MDARVESTAAQLVLPLATGVLIVALDAVVPTEGAGLLALLILLTLGAVLRGHPLRMGAMAAAPVIVAAAVGAAAESAWMAVLLLAAYPIVAAVFAGAVKGGALLVTPATELNETVVER